jgi:glycosyltransferase involved in cell wall biosynthesis
MDIFIKSDSNFSTTRLLTREKPSISNNPSSKVHNLLFLPPNCERKGEGGLRTKGYFKRSFTTINEITQPVKTSKEGKISKTSSIPLVTIVTVVLNGEKYLEETIQSIINQTYDNIEYIIIDGGSTDGTLEIIHKYEAVIDYWVSEPDGGLYDAMNKGIQLTTGELIGLINSDDWYLSNAVSTVVNKYTKDFQNKRVIISGGIFWIDSEGKIMFPIPRSEKFLVERINWDMPLNHSATFVASDVYAILGLFNLKYQIAADYDFIHKAYYSEKIKFFIFDNYYLSCMRLGGLSSKNLASLWTITKESFMLRKHKLPFLKNLKRSVYVFCLYTPYYVLKGLLGSRLTDSLLVAYYRYRYKQCRQVVVQWEQIPQNRKI